LTNGYSRNNFSIESSVDDNDFKRSTIQYINPSSFQTYSYKGRNSLFSSFSGAASNFIGASVNGCQLISTEELYDGLNLNGSAESYIFCTAGLLLFGTRTEDFLTSENFESEIVMLNEKIDIKTKQFLIRTTSGVFGDGLIADFVISDNSEESISTQENRETIPAIISSKNSTVSSGITNSVIIGGENITATENNTVYTQNLNVGDSITTNSLSASIINVSQILSFGPGYLGFDPVEAVNGDMWYRDDLNQIRVKLNDTILIVSTTAPI
jgi:hypothetical protein